jgi:hypothetical protein
VFERMSLYQILTDGDHTTNSIDSRNQLNLFG